MSQLRVGWLAMRQRCDNMGVVGAAAKQPSLKRPLAAVLQSCALFCSRNRLTLRLSHVAGGTQRVCRDAVTRSRQIQ